MRSGRRIVTIPAYAVSNVAVNKVLDDVDAAGYRETGKIPPSTITQIELTLDTVAGVATTTIYIKRSDGTILYTKTTATVANGTYVIQAIGLEWYPISSSDKITLSAVLDAGTANLRPVVHFKD